MERQGTVTSVTSNGLAGTLRDSATSTDYEFTNGANVNIVVGDSVIFITVQLPSGRTIGLVVRKGN